MKRHHNKEKIFEYIKNSLLSIFSCGGVFLLFYFCTGNAFNTLNNFIFLPACCLLFYFYFKKKWMAKDHQIALWSFASIISVIAVIGRQLEISSNISWSVRTILEILLITTTFFPIVYCLIDILKKISEFKEFKITKKYKIIAFFAIFLIGIIVWLLFYPGIYTYDMASQNEMISKGIFTSHWSLTYGLILNAVLEFGAYLFGNYNSGFAMFTFSQLGLVSYISYKIIVAATEITKNKFVYIFGILFFCLVPFFPILAITDAQDVLFGALFALVIIEMFKMMHDPAYFSKKRNIIWFILIAFLMTTIRNNGIYCLLFIIPFVFFLKNKNKWKILSVIAVPIVCSFVYSGPLFNALGIQKTTAINEILGIPSQQLARVYIYENDSLTDEEKTKIEKYYEVKNDFLSYEKYPLISDFTKGALRSDVVSSDLMGYLTLWGSVGVKNMDNYIEAFLLNSLGFWYPLKNYNDDRINLEYMNYVGFTMTNAFSDPEHEMMKKIERQSPDNAITRDLDNIVFNNGWSYIPIISQMGAIGNYFILVIGCICVICAKKRYKLFIAISPIAGLMLTLLLAPVAIYRYIYPVALCVPLLISFILFAIKDKKPEKS